LLVFDAGFSFFRVEFCVFVLEIIYYNVESVFGTPFAPNVPHRQQTTIGWALGRRESKESKALGACHAWVRHQEERRQVVVDRGLYAVVRHPMYAGAIPLSIGMPLWLGSYAAALAAVVPIAILVVRILVEERFLRRELPGYEEYTRKVRWRMVPGVW
jgi:protein-S-isoprenylcysteine O-methyltransferase Ste14